MKTYQKLTSQERDKLAYWHAIGESLREIARRLQRSPSTISDELKRNKVNGIYHSIYAHKATEARKLNSHKKYLLKTRLTLKSYVVEKLGLGWLPEQIAGRSLLKTLKARQYRVKPRISPEHSPKIEPKFPVRFNEFFKLRTLPFRFDGCVIAKNRTSTADVSAIRTEQWKVEHNSAWINNY